MVIEVNHDNNKIKIGGIQLTKQMIAYVGTQPGSVIIDVIDGLTYTGLSVVLSREESIQFAIAIMNLATIGKVKTTVDE
jgi:hypothetical protein